MRIFSAALSDTSISAATSHQSRKVMDTPANAATGTEHWTKKGDVKLFLWEKQATAPGKRGTVLFVHGSSMASQPTFDLQVPGRPYSSAMDYCASLGYDTWCFDMEGYGRSDKTRNINCDIANGADDTVAATSYIMQTRGVKKFLVYGSLRARSGRRCSRNAIRSALRALRSMPSYGRVRAARRSTSGAKSCRSS
jgi:hypothetical protein